MKYFMLITLFISSTAVIAQEGYADFRTQKDSVTFLLLTKKIEFLYQSVDATHALSASMLASIDSLRKAMDNILTSSQAGWHYVYHANKSFTSWSHLLAHTHHLDAIKTLTIENFTGKNYRRR